MGTFSAHREEEPENASLAKKKLRAKYMHMQLHAFKLNDSEMILFVVCKY